MIDNNPSKEQYKIAINKLSATDQHKLADIYFYYPVYDMKELAEKMKVKAVVVVNRILGNLNKKLYFHTKFTHPSEKFSGLYSDPKNGLLSIIHHELHEVQPTMQDLLDGKLSIEERGEFFYPKKICWYMIPKLASALEDLKLVKPKSLISD